MRAYSRKVKLWFLLRKAHRCGVNQLHRCGVNQLHRCGVNQLHRCGVNQLHRCGVIQLHRCGGQQIKQVWGSTNYTGVVLINYTGVVLINIPPITVILKRSFLCVSQSPVQLDDFDSYIKDMAKDSDYKFSLQFEVSGETFSPFCDWQAVGRVRFARGPFPRSVGRACDA